MTLGSRNHTRSDKGFHPTMRLIAIIASILIVVIGSMVTIQSAMPSLYLKLVVTFDIFSFNPEAKTEKKRLDNIALLPISHEKKGFLIDRRVFIGASQVMVELALGEPLDRLSADDTKEGKPVERWIYHFDEDISPTALEFQDGMLATAFSVTKR